MLHFSVSKPFPPHSWEPWSTQPCFHASFLAFSDPSHPTLGNHEAPKPFFMLHFAPSQALPTPLDSWEPWTSFWCFRLFPPHSWEPWETPTPLFMFHFQLSETPLTLGNHEKHPNPFSCFIFSLPKLFPPHSWESWEIPTPVFMLHFYGLFLGTVRNTQTPFMLHFWPFQTLPTPLLGAMKHPNPFSCFIFSVSKPFPPHSWEPWSTQPLFHASFLAFPNHSHNTLGNHFEPSQALPTHSCEPWKQCGVDKNDRCGTWPDPSWIHYMNSGFRSPLLRFHFISFHLISSRLASRHLLRWFLSMSRQVSACLTTSHHVYQIYQVSSCIIMYHHISS